MPSRQQKIEAMIKQLTTKHRSVKAAAEDLHKIIKYAEENDIQGFFLQDHAPKGRPRTKEIK